MQNIIINADDYAMDAGVDAAIMQLAARGVVTAASAMVRSRRWPESARASHDAPKLSWGLHLDLTSPFVDAGFPPQRLFPLMARARAGLLDRARLRREVDSQLSLFEAGRKCAPEFVDGHQHIHQFPAIRETLLDALADRYGRDAMRIGVRICAPRKWRGVKAAIVGGTGAKGLSRLAGERGHSVNSDFAGVYGFAAGANLAALWRGWARGLRGALPLVMCHVALTVSGVSGSGDPIRQARLREYAWLASEEFQSLCQRFAIRPAHWPPA